MTASSAYPSTPDLFLSQTQLQAIAFIERSMGELEPLTALTGSAGTGKTISLATALARRESAGDRVIRVQNFVAGPLTLHRVLAASLGVGDAGELSAEALEPVLRRALAEAGQAEPPLLAVDDAQSLLPETLRYLCLLAGLREAGRPLFRILLVGRPGFTVRQAMPLQFTLEPLHPDDAREVARHGLLAAGAAEGATEEIVRRAQGNLRQLGLLLQAGIEDAQAAGPRRATYAAVPPAAGTRDRTTRRRLPGVWMALPALLALAGTGAVVAYQEGMLGRTADAPAPSASTMPRPPDTQTHPVASAPSAAPEVATAAAPAATGAAVVTTAPPATVAADPHPPSAPVDVAPVVAAPSEPTRLASPAIEPPAAPPPQTQAQGTAQAQAKAQAQAQTQVQAPAPAAVAPSPPPAAALPQAVQPARFRVYNIGACHHGVCPRWSVTDLDRRSRFVAGFDGSALRLDRETMQRLREGSLDLIVSGSLSDQGSAGRVLNAETLQSIVPHHGRHDASDGPIALAPPIQPPQ